MNEVWTCTIRSDFGVSDVAYFRVLFKRKGVGLFNTTRYDTRFLTDVYIPMRTLLEDRDAARELVINKALVKFNEYIKSEYAGKRIAPITFDVNVNTDTLVTSPDAGY